VIRQLGRGSAARLAPADGCGIALAERFRQGWRARYHRQRVPQIGGGSYRHRQARPRHAATASGFKTCTTA